MAIFQQSVINKHINNLDKKQVENAYLKLRENYTLQKIEEIKKLKEEEYQDGFLRDIFVDIFGYTLKPAENYNLAREFKNQTDGKKSDGAILKDGKAIVVIELKSTKTKDLKSITEQAFNYKNNQPDCKYVITSNFQKLRFYIDYANEYEEFDLFNLQKQEFELLYLILHKDSIFADLPLKLKNETKFHEDSISDKLYKDYSNFKHKIYANLVKNNPQYDKLTLFKKSQKFLDRLLFVFFAEDTGLVPPNAISKIVEQWEALQELDEYKTLYSRFVKFFEHLDKGHKYKTYELPAYNGGLFAPDEILDNITIDDEILKDDALKLSAYDFNTDVDVNILGHIFEHSLGEIEQITSELVATATTMGQDSLMTQSKANVSKRKKDGVFYTPKYITQYIVENTIGKLCTEKREELNITEIEFDGTYKTKDGKLSVKGKKLFKTLENYKKWLLSLKIIDPACGSGAFLNQALSFLIEEHKHIDDIIAELTGEAMRLFDTDKAILENNLYGVDINDESVEIAKLSLWLRTAKKGRKLSNLNANIKCGNSLIDDPEVAGDKAFDWHKEFPQVFTEKNKKVWHITTATHNSRYSQRMYDNHVKLGEAIWLDKEDEIIITKTIAEVVKESKFDNNGAYPIDILEYNICGDHMHLLLVCEEEEVSKIIGKIKGRTARERNKGINPLVRPDGDDSRKGGEKAISLWTQKFGKSEIKNENYLNNAIEYIRNNRIKHELPENKEIEKIKKEFLTTKEQAFRTEYKGGFDVVIGNPPYVRIQGLKENYKKESEFYEQNYQAATANYDIYALFIEKAFKLIKKNGNVCFIQPHKFLISDFGVGIRSFLLKHKAVEQLLHFGSHMVFQDASTYTCILKLSYNNQEIKFKHIEPEKINLIANFDTISYDKLSSGKWNLTNNNITKVLDKLKQQPLTVKDVFAKIFQGIATSGDKVYLIKGEEKNGFVVGYSQQLDKTVSIEKGLVKPMLKGEDIAKYKNLENKYWVIFPYLLNDGKAEPMTEDYIKINFPKGYEYLKENETFLRGREHHRFDNDYDWFLFGRKQGISNVEQEKIITPDISFGSNMSFDEGKFYHGTTLYSFIKKQEIKEDYKFYLSILNSSILWFYIKNTGTELRGGYFRFKTNYLNPFPLPKLDNINDQQPFIEKADQMLDLNKQLQAKKTKFLNRVKDNLFAKGACPLGLKLSKKLEAFYDYNFKTFVSELKKKKIKLSLVQQDEWEEYFNAYKTEINNLQNQISQTDKEIDQMVYQLYELTDEEIKIVEESV